MWKTATQRRRPGHWKLAAFEFRVVISLPWAFLATLEVSIVTKTSSVWLTVSKWHWVITSEGIFYQPPSYKPREYCNEAVGSLRIEMSDATTKHTQTKYCNLLAHAHQGIKFSWAVNFGQFVENILWLRYTKPHPGTMRYCFVGKVCGFPLNHENH